MVPYHISRPVRYSGLVQEEYTRRRRFSMRYLSQRRMKSLMLLGILSGAAYTLYQLHYNAKTNPTKTAGQKTRNIYEKAIPSWTWLCKKFRCIRTHASNKTIQQSLKTCNMRCSQFGSIWPYPTLTYQQKKIIVPLDIRRITLTTNSPKTVAPYLHEAFDLMKKDIENSVAVYKTKHKELMEATGLSINVSVKNEDPLLRLSTVESYALTVIQLENKVIAKIVAHSFCGARHALETLSQLIWFDEVMGSAVTFKEVHINDAPKFPYRGLLLDTARNFIPVEDILRTLDAMAASKLNTFHWHATDSQSFPLQLRSVPEFAKYGAYSRKEVYTTKDIKTIVHRARVRGIRVVIEVDGPAHVGPAWSWGNGSGLGNLVHCLAAKPWEQYCGQPPCGQLNPHNPNVYWLLEEVYREILELTDVKDVFHLGGDEISEECWSNETDWMNTFVKYIENAKTALQNANNGIFPEIIILWSSKVISAFSEKLIKKIQQTIFGYFTIQVWGSSEWDDQIVIEKSGLKMIMSHVNAWYLDCGFGFSLKATESGCPYVDERQAYNHAPWDNYATWDVLGGEACLWSELVGRESLDSRLWPRAAAVAERLWTDPPGKMDIDTVLRLEMHRKRLIERGVGAQVIGPRWCMEDPYRCL